MLAEAGIAITPDVDSTTPVATGFLRFSYCGPENDMREAAGRLKAWRSDWLWNVPDRQTAEAGPPVGTSSVTGHYRQIHCGWRR
jgi:hypothetical protein